MVARRMLDPRQGLVFLVAAALLAGCGHGAEYQTLTGIEHVPRYHAGLKATEPL